MVEPDAARLVVVDDPDFLAYLLHHPDGRAVANPEVPGGVDWQAFLHRHVADAALLLGL